MKAHEKLNYVEFAARDLAATKAFFQAEFSWQFVDCGPDYCAFADEGLDGGFYRANTVHHQSPTIRLPRWPPFPLR